VSAEDATEVAAADRDSETTAHDEDPRLRALRAAVDRLREELRGYPSALADREVAEGELAALDGMAAKGVPDATALRHALLLIAAAVGSFSALAPAVTGLRQAVELFCGPLDPAQAHWSAAR
jgi:hypothetical protein